MDELIIKEQETRENLVKIINESNLPAFMLEPMLKEMYEQVSKIKEQQYQAAKENQQRKKEKKKEDK